MKRISPICAAFLLAVFAGIAPAEASAPPKIGDSAPDFTLTDQNGARLRLSQSRGDKVVLVFYRGYW